MIPKPFGPRMQVSDALAALERAFKQIGIKSPVTMPAPGDVRWVELMLALLQGRPSTCTTR
jgi:hypothetical protein